MRFVGFFLIGLEPNKKSLQVSGLNIFSRGFVVRGVFKSCLSEYTTSRLYIRRCCAIDYEDCFSIYSDPELTQFFDHGEPRSQKEVEQYLFQRNQLFLDRREPFGLFSVFLRDSLIFIGQVDVVPTSIPGEVEIGWIFRKEYQNMGYCSEAVKEFLIPFVKKLARKGTKVLGQEISRIVATAHPENKASQRIMAKVGLSFYKKGFCYEGKPRNWYEKDLKKDTIKWNPKRYSELSFAQKQIALDFIQKLAIRKNDSILDIGCGDGQITANLALLASKGSVLGLDVSEEMVAFAKNQYEKKQYSELSFQVGDAIDIQFQESFDIIFSSFALQWIEDKTLFFDRCYNALKNKGKIGITLPLNVSFELEKATDTMMASPSWVKFYKKFHPGWYFVDGAYLTSLLEKSGFHLVYEDTFFQEIRFSSLQDFKSYVLLWYPYLKPLRGELKGEFFSEVVSKYCELMPLTRDGSVNMRFPVLSLIGIKK